MPARTSSAGFSTSVNQGVQLSKITTLIVAALLTVQSAWAGEGAFKLKNGDKVVFYGDSITDLRQYTVIAETLVVTRYPRLNVDFVNSGWGGDSVSGGGGGPIDTRLQRDVFAYRPTVVSIMLGMNDGGYKAETDADDEKFFTGYKHIVESMRTNLPDVRIWAIEPSPYDDVTRPPAFPVPAGVTYNEVLRSYGKWIANHADQLGVNLADANSGMVEALKRAMELDPENAKQILPDHIHPSFGGSLLLAEGLLKAWQTRPEVSAVELKVLNETATVKSARFASVSGLTSGSAVAWTELDESLPLPFKQWEEMWGGGPAVGLAIRSSDITAALNRQLLKVEGLPSGTYSLKIDGAEVGAFNNDELASGVNLALLKTPATEQAMKVYRLANLREEIHYDRWRNIDVPLAEYGLPEAVAASTSLNTLDDAVARKMREIAQPVSHRFELAPIGDK
jgi:lysophospholipase L1-like esterase